MGIETVVVEVVIFIEVVVKAVEVELDKVVLDVELASIEVVVVDDSGGKRGEIVRTRGLTLPSSQGGEGAQVGMDGTTLTIISAAPAIRH